MAYIPPNINGQATKANSQPVVLASDTDVLPVSAVSLPLPAGASTESTLALIKAKTDNLDVALSTRAVTGLTDSQLRATAVPVSGTVAVTGVATAANQLPNNHNVVVTSAPTTAVTGPLTDTELRATPVPVSSTLSAPLVSTINSTSTPLAANATFTGGWDSVANYDFAEIVVTTDQNSSTNGAIVMLSTDGGTTTHKSIANTITGGYGGLSFVIPLTAYTAIKLVYTNGAIAQTLFNSRVTYQAGANATPIAPLSAQIDPTLSAGLVRAVLAAQNPTGLIANLITTSGGFLRNSISNVEVDVPIKALTGLSINQMGLSTTAVQISSSVTARKTVSLKALAANAAAVYLGTSAAVTTSTGYEISAGDSIDLELTEVQSIWAIAASGTPRLSVMEIT